jgi:hypothetical protein
MTFGINDKKIKFEATILSHFLAQQHLAYAPRDSSDAHHDGWAVEGGKRIAELELTRYIVDEVSSIGSRQLMAAGVWNRDVWPLVDAHRRKRPELRNVMASVAFTITPPRKMTSRTLAEELVNVSASAWGARNAQNPLPLIQSEPVVSVFIEDRTGRTSNFQEYGTAFLNLDPRLYPLVTSHVRQIHLSVASEDWPEWWGPDMSGGNVSYCSECLRRLLNDKAVKIQGRRLGDYPVWLVILCDLFDDVRTMIYPHDVVGHQIQSMFAGCGYDFSASPFQRIWLMSQVYGNSMEIELPS